MPLQWNNISIPLTGGVDTKSSDKTVLPTKVLSLENAVFDHPGEVAVEAGEGRDVLAAVGDEVLHDAARDARPRLEVKPRRVGGATYQVPIEVRQERGTSIALRWIRDFAQHRKGKPMQEKLADEIIAAYKGEGSAIKKRDDTHKMAESNKAYAHFRW